MVPPGFLGVERGVPTVPNTKSVNAKVIHPYLTLGEPGYGGRLRYPIACMETRKFLIREECSSA